jgi:hypothetical protein
MKIARSVFWTVAILGWVAIAADIYHAHQLGQPLDAWNTGFAILAIAVCVVKMVGDLLKPWAED